MKNVISVLIYSLLYLPLSLYAIDLNFSQISSHNGLSQNTVRAIAEDKNGFIWAGTLDGLNRYDGYNMRSYQLRVGSPNSLRDHRIRDLFVDRLGNLWLKTYRNEFSCYDPITDSFLHIKDETGELFTYEFYHESTQGDVWLWGKNDGVLRCKRNEAGSALEQEIILPKLPAKNRCNFLFEDSKGNIWIGKEDGLQVVCHDNSFKEYYSGDKMYAITKATEDNGKIFFSTGQSVIIIYDLEKQTFKEVKYDANAVFTDIAYLSENKLILLSQSHGILIYDISSGIFKKSELNNDSDLKGYIRMLVDKEKGVWVYNTSGMVWYYNQQRKQMRKMRLIPEEITNMMDLERYLILIDSDGLIWITTYGNGLFCYNPHTDELSNYTNSSDPNSLASNYLLSIMEDRSGNIWVGSEYAGMIRIVKTPGYIRFVRPETETIIGRTNNVRTIFEDSHGNIWIGTKNGHLYVYNAELTLGKCIGESLNPYALAEDEKQRMWVGTKGNGLYLYDINSFHETAHFIYNSKQHNSLSHDVIFQIIKDTKDRIWIASFGGGLSLVEELGSHVSFRHFIRNKGSKSLIRCLYQDSKGMIWAGSSDGLIKFDPDELIGNPEAYTCYIMDMNHPNSLSSNDIKVIFEDSTKTLWIGTAGGGLNKLIEATEAENEHFLSFTAADGMADNYVLGILEYKEYLWISSENGLTRFHKTDYTTSVYQFAQKPFGNIFNEGAYCQRQNGEMLWGNLDGLLVFNPAKFSSDDYTPPVLLTSLQIDGFDWNDITNRSTDRSISYTDNIKLNYKQNTFTLEFATLTLRNPDKNQYTFILENYDKNWSQPGHSNTVTYKNLSPGKYTFKVKGANPDGIWNNEMTTLNITITPPFWKMPVAYIFYFFLLMIILYIAFRLILKFNRLNNAVEVEKQLTNHKLRFFTNISHEFRTPLTLIQGAVESLNEQTDLPASVNKQVNILSRNATNLRRLIDQLLEFRKLQNDILKLDLEETDMIAFAYDIYNGFRELAERKGIHYLFTATDDRLLMYIDSKKMDKILFNLLSNAFKFTPKNGTIELILTYDETIQKCLISVRDSGVGIPKEKQHLLFSRFTQINVSVSGTGIGLSLVKEFVDVHKGKISYEDNPGGGSIFKIELSTSKETYKGENFITHTQPDIAQKEQASASVSVADLTSIDSKTLADYQLLIIDDNDDIRDFLTGEFCKYLKVETAVDGKEGLQKAIDINPDLIICDVMMPEMDGFEVTRQLKNEFQTCHIPIILLTAHSSIEHQLEGIESGADAYITKPFSLKYIVKRVMKLIEQRELLKKRFSKDFVMDGNLINTTDKDKLFFDKIEKILEDNYQDSQFTLDRFVELAGTRRTIFFKKVKGITGFSPNELLKIKRLNRSAALLKQGELNVSEISYKVGFDDPYYFSKCFKIHFNCTPTQYKSKSGEET
jgi:signal transduction histidine kinase/ligand-binding sensor domain-containing protein/CheY-like chemotaxis protein